MVRMVLLSLADSSLPHACRFTLEIPRFDDRGVKLSNINPPSPPRPCSWGRVDHQLHINYKSLPSQSLGRGFIPFPTLPRGSFSQCCGSPGSTCTPFSQYLRPFGRLWALLFHNFHDLFRILSKFYIQKQPPSYISSKNMFFCDCPCSRTNKNNENHWKTRVFSMILLISQLSGFQSLGIDSGQFFNDFQWLWLLRWLWRL